MKTKNKNSKTNIIIESKKSEKKIVPPVNYKSVSKSKEAQVRKNLESTIKLLQFRLNVKK